LSTSMNVLKLLFFVTLIASLVFSSLQMDSLKDLEEALQDIGTQDSQALQASQAKEEPKPSLSPRKKLIANRSQKTQLSLEAQIHAELLQSEILEADRNIENLEISLQNLAFQELRSELEHLKKELEHLKKELEGANIKKDQAYTKDIKEEVQDYLEETYLKNKENIDHFLQDLRAENALKSLEKNIEEIYQNLKKEEQDIRDNLEDLEDDPKMMKELKKIEEDIETIYERKKKWSQNLQHVKDDPQVLKVLQDLKDDPQVLKELKHIEEKYQSWKKFLQDLQDLQDLQYYSKILQSLREVIEEEDKETQTTLQVLKNQTYKQLLGDLKQLPALRDLEKTPSFGKSKHKKLKAPKKFEARKRRSQAVLARAVPPKRASSNNK
ncbi:hypothetical protein DI09_164p10, partial [Mitosporidium daphniae]